MNPITVVRYTDGDELKWDQFVAQHADATLFHFRRFLSYHPSGRFLDHSLLFFKKNNLIGVLPANESIDNSEKSLFSHQGTSFAGFLISKPSVERYDALLHVFLKYCQQQNFKHIYITLPPAAYTTIPADGLLFFLLKAGFFYKKQELTSIISVPQFGTDILSGFTNKARTNVKKALKEELNCSFSDNVHSFFTMMTKHFSEKHGITPTHSQPEIEDLMSRFPERVKILGLYKENKLIAGTLLFRVTTNTVLTFYLAMDTDFQNIRPLNLLIYRLIEWAQSQNVWYIDFGTITINMELNSGLAKFKENFAARPWFRNTLQLTM